MQGGDQIAIATREAQRGDDLDALEASVLTRFRSEAEAERAGRAAATASARPRLFDGSSRRCAPTAAGVDV